MCYITSEKSYMIHTYIKMNYEVLVNNMNLSKAGLDKVDKVSHLLRAGMEGGIWLFCYEGLLIEIIGKIE